MGVCGCRWYKAGITTALLGGPYLRASPTRKRASPSSKARSRRGGQVQRRTGGPGTQSSSDVLLRSQPLSLPRFSHSLRSSKDGPKTGEQRRLELVRDGLLSRKQAVQVGQEQLFPWSSSPLSYLLFGALGLRLALCSFFHSPLSPTVSRGRSMRDLPNSHSGPHAEVGSP